MDSLLRRNTEITMEVGLRQILWGQASSMAAHMRNVNAASTVTLRT
jgi:hypothetical protein